MDPSEPRSFTFPGASRALGSHPAVRDGRPGVTGDLHSTPRSSLLLDPAGTTSPPPQPAPPPPPPPAPKTAAQCNGLLTVLAQLMPFQGFEREDLMAMVEAMGARATAPDELVVAQGADARCFHVVEHGKFAFLRDGAPVAQCRDMGHFAELALLYDCAVEHTVVSAGEGLLWVLDRAVYRRILHRREQEHRLRIAALVETTPTLRQLGSDRLVAIAKVRRARAWCRCRARES
jgi:hypothetical protein